MKNNGDIIIQKYGGTSVENPERLKEVAGRIVRAKEAGDRIVVVVSAMGNTTDELVELAHQVSPVPSRRELDMLLSVGERISMTLLSMAINDLGHQAISFTGSQSGIITDERHTNARIVEVRASRIREELEKDKVVIVAGYQGVSRSKEVTTLGRGGSDTTAIALAAALGARVCEICTDVDGVYTADPTMVKSAQKHDLLSFDEMLALSSTGGIVLKKEAMEYARSHGIRMEIRSSFTTEPGTVVEDRNGEDKHRVTGIMQQRNLLAFLFRGSKAQEAALDFIRELTAHGIEVRDFILDCSDEDTNARHLFVAVSVPHEYDRNYVLTTADIALGEFDHRVIDCGSVSIVAGSDEYLSTLYANVLDILNKHSVKVFGMKKELSIISVYIEDDAVVKVVNLLHEDLFE